MRPPPWASPHCRPIQKLDLEPIDSTGLPPTLELVHWPAEPVDPFFNVNTPEDAAQAQALAAKYSDAARPRDSGDPKLDTRLRGNERSGQPSKDA
jgi:hypothetical protein